MLFLLAMCYTGGCITGEISHKKTSVNGKTSVMKAGYAPVPITVDGILDEDVWTHADAYVMSLPGDLALNDRQLEEDAQVRLAWDDTYFYVGVRFQDSDIVAEGDSDQIAHSRLGDLCEVFLKPAAETWYWELYVTPKNHKTSFWYPGRGRLGLPSNLEYECGLMTGANCYGTLNNWRDKDGAWTAELAMPIKDLTARGENFDPEGVRNFFLARYNQCLYNDLQ